MRILFIATLAVVLAFAGACPNLPTSKCDRVQNGNCYIHGKKAVTWNQAEQCCIEWGGHLASIHSKQEESTVNSIRNTKHWTWIGLHDTIKEGNFKWTDGTPANYINFHRNEPNSAGGQENCVNLLSESHQLKWNDLKCDDKREFVCKKVVESKEIQWDEWKSFFEKIYESKEEEKKRKQIWRDNRVYINSFKREKHSHMLELNEFADLTNEEFREYHLGRILDSSHKAKNGTMHEQKIPDCDLPITVNWLTKGAVTRVKNQGRCGSCWAFSATGALEGQYFMKHKALKSFSEQQLIDCSRCYKNNGCKGGIPSNAFWYWESHKAETESEYSYEGKDGNCGYNEQGNSDSNYRYIQSGSILALKDAVSSVGPISVVMDASHKSFQFYKKGIYSEKNCRSNNRAMDHAVLVVGYGNENGKDYWLVKNSWGTEWGSCGYFKIAMEDNMCGICTGASYPVIS